MIEDKEGGSRRGLTKPGHTYEIQYLDGHVIFTNDREEVIVISEQDADLLRYYWRTDAWGYPVRGYWGGDESKQEKLHKVISKRMGIEEEGFDIDHIDRNKLNASRGNLRSVNAIQNSINRDASVRSKTGILGVCYCPEPRRKWKATMAGKSAYFHTQEEAVVQRKQWEADRWTEVAGVKNK